MNIGESKSQEVSLREIAQHFLRKNDRYQKFHGKLFSHLCPSREIFLDVAQKIDWASLPSKFFHPAVLLLGRFGPMISIESSMVPSTHEGQLHLNNFLREAKLPDADMVAIISPIDIKGDTADARRAFEAINFVRSILLLHFGKLATFSWHYDFEFDCDGTLSLPGKAFRMPLFADFVSFSDVSVANEVLAALAGCHIEYRTKFQTACNMIGAALDQENEAFRFSAYRLALEIIGGKSGALKSKLASAYGEKTPFIDSFLRFKELAKMRHDLMHKGKFGFFYSYQERLLQTYFWDIARQQLGLSCRGLTKALIEQGCSTLSTDGHCQY